MHLREMNCVQETILQKSRRGYSRILKVSETPEAELYHPVLEIGMSSAITATGWRSSLSRYSKTCQTP